MNDVDIKVQPEVLRQAAKGINDLISHLSGGALGSYTGQLGRGFDDMALTGEQMSHGDAKAGLDNFVQRWEWGTRTLVNKASYIGRGLHLGAGRFEKQDQYFANAGKSMLNDLAGDPSLRQQSVKDPQGNILVAGTDDMSLGEVFDHNVNQLAHPDWSAQSFQDALPQLQQSWGVVKDNALQAAENGVIVSNPELAPVLTAGSRLPSPGPLG